MQMMQKEAAVTSWRTGRPVVDLAKEYMGVSKKRGTPKWMVYDGKPY